MEKEIKQCKICQKEIVVPECYWESYDCCSACIRKAVLELRKEKEIDELIGYAEKEGYISDGETWTKEQKESYYNKCQAI